MTRKPFPEDTTPEFLRALQERQKHNQLLGEALVRNLKAEKLEREFRQQEFKKAKLKALRVLARTQDIADRHAQEVMAKARRIVGPPRRDD